MQFAGVLPPDAPDPRGEARARLQNLPFPVMGLVPQASIEDHDSFGTEEGHDAGGRWALAVSIGYTFWRNPDDRDDPVNLADLDDQTRASIDTEPPWPRPAWLIEAVQRMRYPLIEEAVRTSWHRTQSEHTTLSRQLVHHANHILMNHFRTELGLAPGPLTDRAWQASESAVNSAATLEVDGVEVPASEIDTDPFVYAIGAQVSPAVVATVVVSREYLPFLRIAIATRALGE
jgi:hypothetical protein